MSAEWTIAQLREKIRSMFPLSKAAEICHHEGNKGEEIVCNSGNKSPGFKEGGAVRGTLYSP